MDLDCFYRGDPVRCDRPINPGTKVRPRCKVAYHISDPSVSFIETECQADGTWEVPLFRCVPGKQPPVKYPETTQHRPIILYIYNLFLVMSNQSKVPPIKHFPWEKQQDSYESNVIRR